MADIQTKKAAEEPGAASLAVTVPAEHVREAEERAATAYQRRVRLPGFRKGKAPAAIVKKQFAEDIRQQVLEELISESWTAALKQEALKPIADPHIHNLKWDAGEGAPVTFEFHVEVKPDLKLERLGGFRLQRTVQPVTDEQVTAQLHELKRQQLAELDDAFAREMGDFESLDALRRAVRTDLEKDAEREADARVRGELLEQIVAANHLTAPRPLVERALYVYAQAYGIPEDRLPQFATEFRPVAEAQVRRDLILDYVLERQQLRATEAELGQRLEELAQRRNMAAGELRASLEKAKRLRDVERSITEEKVFAYLLSQSTVEQP